MVLIFLFVELAGSLGWWLSGVWGGFQPITLSLPTQVRLGCWVNGGFHSIMCSHKFVLGGGWAVTYHVHNCSSEKKI